MTTTLTKDMPVQFNNAVRTVTVKSIPKEMFDEQAEKQCFNCHGVSLEKTHELGGFTAVEAICVLSNVISLSMSYDEAHLILDGMIRRWESQQTIVADYAESHRLQAEEIEELQHMLDHRDKTLDMVRLGIAKHVLPSLIGPLSKIAFSDPSNESVAKEALRYADALIEQGKTNDQKQNTYTKTCRYSCWITHSDAPTNHENEPRSAW